MLLPSKRKYKKRFTKTEKVSPSRARKLLATMVHNNRPVDLRRVKRYVKKMLEGTWRSTSQGLIIDWFGRLGNGQHRLLAVIESGVTIEIDITYGEDPENFLIWDKHKQRTLTDDFFIAEIEHPKESARMYRVYLDLLETTPKRFVALGHRRGVSHEDALTWCRQNEHARLHVIEKCKAKEARRRLRPPAIFMGVYYYLYERTPDAADSFFDQLIHGAAGSVDPVTQLRESLDQLMIESMRGVTIPKYVYAALVFKAFNAWMARKSVESIWFDPSEGFPEVTSRQRRR